MKFLLAATIPAWRDLAPTRNNQHHANELVKAAGIVLNSIANNGATRGQIKWENLTLHYELEPETAAKPADDKAA